MIGFIFLNTRFIFSKSSFQYTSYFTNTRFIRGGGLINLKTFFKSINSGSFTGFYHSTFTQRRDQSLYQFTLFK